MPEVLSRSGLPIVSDFAEGKGTPLVINDDNGRGYVLVNNTVTPLGTDVLNILDYEPNAGDGVTNASVALQAMINQAAAAGGGHIVLPGNGRTYRLTSGIANNSIGNNLIIEGLGGSTIVKEFDGTLFPLIGGPANLKFRNMTINANGGTYTGELLYFGQFCENIDVCGWTVTNGANSIFTYQGNGGDHSYIHNSVFTLHSSTVAAGAVIINDSVDTAATRRFWHNCFCGLATWFYRGTGLESFYASEIYSAGISFTGSTSLGCTIRGSRFAIPTGQTMVLDGNGLIVNDNEIGGNLTINVGFINSQFRSNIMDPAATFTNSAPSNAVVENPISPYYNRWHPVVATASLPAASTAMNGTMILEDAGAGDRNLIIYAGGQRFRIDGGAAF